ncbi:MAG: hypothetical protein L6R35_007508, partial [Caloplaca aegaea]
MTTSRSLGNGRGGDYLVNHHGTLERVITVPLVSLTINQGPATKVKGRKRATMPPGFIRRALSPVHFDVLQAEPDDILCPGSDFDEDPAYYRAKRRRVENAAQEYLRGKSVYIASARLRGPFPQGWRNPFTLQEEERRITMERKQQLWQEEQRQLERQPSQSEAHLISNDADKAGPYKTGYPIALPEESVEDIKTAANPDILQQSVEKNPEFPAERPIVNSKEEPRLAKPSGPGNHDWLKISKTFATSKFRSG